MEGKGHINAISSDVGQLTNGNHKFEFNRSTKAINTPKKFHAIVQVGCSKTSTRGSQTVRCIKYEAACQTAPELYYNHNNRVENSRYKKADASTQTESVLSECDYYRNINNINELIANIPCFPALYNSILRSPELSVLKELIVKYVQHENNSLSLSYDK